MVGYSYENKAPVVVSKGGCAPFGGGLGVPPRKTPSGWAGGTVALKSQEVVAFSRSAPAGESGEGRALSGGGLGVSPSYTYQQGAEERGVQSGEAPLQGV